MGRNNILALAQRLDEAALSVTATDQIAEAAGVDVPTAYAIQQALIERRLARGESVVGLKLGLTSKAKMAQMGVDEVIWGQLTDAMRIPAGGMVDTSRFIHPRVEPEVAFLLSRRPSGDDPDFAATVRAVAPAVELIDSRYTGFRFTLADVIADNTSAAAFAIGAWQPVPAGLENLGVLLEIDGRISQIGSTAAILGDPRRALADAARLAGRYGVIPRKGWVLLAGAATAAVSLHPGAHVRAVVQGLGSVAFRAAPR
jgi:2-oxo-3-hexenedioate decarboxylase